MNRIELGKRILTVAAMSVVAVLAIGTTVAITEILGEQREIRTLQIENLKLDNEIKKHKLK